MWLDKLIRANQQTRPSTSTMSQIPKFSYKVWLETSIRRDGSIFCCPESDIKLDDEPISLGASGAVYKGTVGLKSRFNIITKKIQGKRRNVLSSGMTVAVKTLLPDNQCDCGEDLYQQFVKEVAYQVNLLLCLLYSSLCKVF